MNDRDSLNHPFALKKGEPISLFSGILVRMAQDALSEPHFYVEFDDQEAVLSIPEGKVISGNVPLQKLRILEGWLSLHEDEMMANWTLLKRNERLYPVNPLR